jgi:non-ribosomal peptide synthetase component F
MGPETRALQFAAHVFDVSNSEVFTTLMRGGCVGVPSEEERLNDLAGAVRRCGVNWSFQVPTTVDTLNPDAVPRLEYLVLGGEAIREGLCERWVGRVRLFDCRLLLFCGCPLPLPLLFTYP